MEGVKGKEDGGSGRKALGKDKGERKKLGWVETTSRHHMHRIEGFVFWTLNYYWQPPFNKHILS
jgi:hypothetical protein